jgi:hypothetical protein
MRALLQNLSSSTSHTSLAASFRKKRFALFREFISKIDRSPLTILDVGGRQEFWEVMGFTDTPHKIILLNLFKGTVTHPNFTAIAGDARNLHEFPDRAIDVVFSNSVIEHLHTYANQQRMADEIRRVGKTYFVQTPNMMFPVEPHFLCPFFHWLPFSARVEIIRRMSLGHKNRQPTREAAVAAVSEFRLLRKSELRALFPDAVLYREKFLGLTKSFTAVKH